MYKRQYVETAKEKASEYIPIASEAIENAIETAKEKAGDLADKAEEMAENVVETVKEKIHSFSDDANEEAPAKPTEETNRVEEDAD